MNWHQKQAARRAWQTRNIPAHIRAEDWIQTGKTLCGLSRHEVHIDPEHRGNPANKVCKHCARIADKLKLPAL